MTSLYNHSMGEETIIEEMQQLQHEEDARPLVLLFGPLSLVHVFGNDEMFRKFRFLKPWASPMVPVHQFLITHAKDVRAVLCLGKTPLGVDTLECLPSLECVVACSAGLDHIDIDECKRRGVAVASAGNAYSEDAADYVVGMLLDVFRKVSCADRYVRAGRWPIKGEYRLGSKVAGRRVGIVGLGNIGLEVAKRLEAFRCVISYTSRTKKSYVDFPYYKNVYDLASNNDILILLCPLNRDTFHMISKDVLLVLGKEGIVMNIGRGGLINEAEFVRCLVHGDIAGAGLDVFENEPDVPKQLLALDNVVLSPHKAVFTPQSFSTLHELIIANLEAFFANKPILSPV